MNMALMLTRRAPAVPEHDRSTVEDRYRTYASNLNGFPAPEPAVVAA
jgi:hypothetical protein